jgi:uncharacterized protein
MNSTRRTRILFTSMLVAVGLHVVDDAFLQPQAGTSAGDHLARGLVPLLLIAVSVPLFARVRAGARAALAAAWSVAAVVNGVEAVYYSGHGGLAGDDYSGLLALAAGPVLAAIAAVDLWRSRRLDERRLRRYPRRLVTAVVIAFGASLVVLPFAIAYIGGHVARTEVARFDVPHQDVTLRTSDGLRLEGWYVPSRNRAAVIVFPGRKAPLGRARMLARHGYGVLLFDRRGEGRSQGDPDGFGWNFNKDIRAGIDFLARQPDVDAGRIGGIGLSVGGEMMLQTASETKDLAAVVAEGAGARTASEEVDDAHGLDKLFAAISYGVRDATNAVGQGTAPPPNLKTVVAKIAPRAVFFIHAGADDVGTLGPDYYRAARQPKQIWETAGGHTQAFATEPREYESRVIRFFDGALRPAGTQHPQRQSARD